MYCIHRKNICEAVLHFRKRITYTNTEIVTLKYYDIVIYIDFYAIFAGVKR